MFFFSPQKKHQVGLRHTPPSRALSPSLSLCGKKKWGNERFLLARALIGARSSCATSGREERQKRRAKDRED